MGSLVRSAEAIAAFPEITARHSACFMTLAIPGLREVLLGDDHR